MRMPPPSDGDVGGWTLTIFLSSHLFTHAGACEVVLCFEHAGVTAKCGAWGALKYYAWPALYAWDTTGHVCCVCEERNGPKGTGMSSFARHYLTYAGQYGTI